MINVAQLFIQLVQFIIQEEFQIISGGAEFASYQQTFIVKVLESL
jgi:hypothetical protein